MLLKRKSGRERRVGKWGRIAIAATAAAIGIGTIGVVGASAGHSTLNATVGCQENSWSLNFDGSFFAAPFINLVRIRLLDGPAEALAEVPAAGFWDSMSHANPDPHDFDHSVVGTIDFGLTFPKTVSTVTLKFQINFVDLHIGVPGDPIEHPDTELIRTITRTNNCTFAVDTTTTPPTTTPRAVTTTKAGEPAAVHAVTPQCISDAPFIDVTFGPEPQYVGLDAHITFIDINGNTVGTHTAPYVPNGNVRLVYPGATVDAAGNATDWPGWKLAPNGNWIPDPSDAHLREGLKVRIEVNPTFETLVGYPPESSGCASPPPPQCVHSTTTTSGGSGSTSLPPNPPTCETTVPPSASTLPATGSDLPRTVTVGALVSLAVGALAVGTTRRRAHHT